MNTAKRLYLYDDFTATIRIHPPEEGGRTTPPHNGIRWDFSYAGDDSGKLYMIWPDFHDANGDSINGELPVNTALSARMVVVDDMRRDIHSARLQPGVHFHCHEGAKIVATGQVETITGLYKTRDHTHIYPQ